jgi:hypothetical protein
VKVEFYCDSGANIHSRKREIFDTVKDLGLDEGEWEKLSEDEKYKLAEEWAYEQMSIGFREIGE